MADHRRRTRRKTAKIETADRKVARAAGSERDTAWMKVVGQASELADQPPLIALSAATIAAGVLLGKARLARTGIRMLASHWLATQAKSFIKHRVDRTRPFVMLGGDSYHAHKGHSHAKRENSFPSGHTAGAVAVARAVARDYPASAPLGYAAATAAGAVQLPRGAHFLSDVLAGAAIGLLAEAAVRLILPPAKARTSGSPPASGRIVAADPANGSESVCARAEAVDAGLLAGERERVDLGGDESGYAFPMNPLERARPGDLAIAANQGRETVDPLQPDRKST